MRGRATPRECGMRNAECGIEGDGSIPGASSRNRPALGPFRIPHSAFRILGGWG